MESIKMEEVNLNFIEVLTPSQVKVFELNELFGTKNIKYIIEPEKLHFNYSIKLNSSERRFTSVEITKLVVFLKFSWEVLKQNLTQEELELFRYLDDFDTPNKDVFNTYRNNDFKGYVELGSHKPLKHKGKPWKIENRSEFKPNGSHAFNFCEIYLEQSLIILY